MRDAASALEATDRIVVMGAGKAGATMSVALEASLGERLDSVVGWVNVPAGTERPTRRIHLHPARPMASNHPTEEGVAGSREILRLARSAGPNDIGIGLWSGGGSALLPLPADGISLDDKQQVTKLLHECGATINEMNTVRKHLSAIKGGRLAEAFAGRRLFSFILSDVVGDPIDVIASGPTAADPTTIADAVRVILVHELWDRIPLAVRSFFDRAIASPSANVPRVLPNGVTNRIIGNNALALGTAETVAASLGYRVVNLGSFIEGETANVACVFADIVRSVTRDGRPAAPPVCILSGGETTVTLPPAHGRGGRNQEFVLAMLDRLGPEGMAGVTILSGGTDGEDGPTDAAGAIADSQTLHRAAHSLNLKACLHLHDAYPFFAATGDLLMSGPTGTNVMDVRVILISPARTA